MNTLDDIAREQAAPAADEEEKKRKKKRNLLVGLAALAVIGGSAVCLSTGIVDKLKPAPEPTQEVAVMVEPTDAAYAPLPTATAVTLSPTPTTPVEAYDVRDAWYGNYEGTAEGRRQSDRGTINEFYRDNELLWLEIRNEEDCIAFQYCNESQSWGLDIDFVGPTAAESWVNIRLYLPNNPSDAPGLTITDDTITLIPTEDHPYEMVIEKRDGQLEGYIRANGIPGPVGNHLVIWEVDYLTAVETDAPFPAQR